MTKFVLVNIWFYLYSKLYCNFHLELKDNNHVNDVFIYVNQIFRWALVYLTESVISDNFVNPLKEVVRGRIFRACQGHLGVGTKCPIRLG